MDNLELIEGQCLTTRKIGGWFDHPNRGVIEVSGNDRIGFLHNILTNDIKKLTPGTGMQACLLNAQAKIIAVMNVLCFENLVWLAFDYVLKGRLREALEKLIIMEEVALKDRSDELKLISVHGPKAKELVSVVLSEAKDPSRDSSPDRPSSTGEPSGHPPLEQPAAFGLRMTALPEMLSHTRVSERILIIRINPIGEEGYGVLFPKSETEKMRKSIAEKASSLGMVEIKPEVMEVMRIAAGIPKYGVDYDESNIPLECRLDHTISFTKGCFPGQEIIARLDSRGGVAKKLCGLWMKGDLIPKKDDRILDNGIEVGHVTSAAFVPILKKTAALAYLKKGSWGIGRAVNVEIGKFQIPARVEELPFYSADN